MPSSYTVASAVRLSPCCLTTLCLNIIYLCQSVTWTPKMSVFSYQLMTWGKFIFWIALRKCQQHWKQLTTSNWLILAELSKENAYKHKWGVKGTCKLVHVSRAPLPPVGLKGPSLGGEGFLSGVAACRKGGELDYKDIQTGIPENNDPPLSFWFACVPIDQTQWEDKEQGNLLLSPYFLVC